jgi:hypothetical protein
MLGGARVKLSKLVTVSVCMYIFLISQEKNKWMPVAIFCYIADTNIFLQSQKLFFLYGKDCLK